jgi:hypothetical protein
MSNAKATRVLTKALSLVTRQQSALAKSSDAIKKALVSAQALTSADGDAKPAKKVAAKVAARKVAAKVAAKPAKKVAAKVAAKPAKKVAAKVAAKPAKKVAAKVAAKPAKALKKSRITEDDFPEE